MPSTHKLAVILFADIEGYTAMMQADEEGVLSLLNRFKLVLEAETAQNEGRVIQYLGDGALLTFESAASAVTCAMAMQSAFRAEPFVPVRIGIHLGDVLFKEGNIFGDGVNVASRIESLSVAGAVLMSKTIRDQLKNKASFQTTSLGDFEFKNVQEPMEVFALSNEGFVVPKRGEMKGKLKGKKSSFFKQNWIIATAIAFLGILTWNYWPDTSNSSSKTGSSAILQEQKSIAVLPFRNLSGDSSQVYFSDGMSEEVLNALTQLEDLKVSARTSSFKFRGDKIDLAEVGEKLGVKTVLEGSVRKSGNRVRIMARLINIADESQMWSERFDRELEDVFAIQDEIAQAIVWELKLKFVGEESGKSLVKAPTENKKAYDLYLKGNHFLNKGYIQDAATYYEQALEHDSSLAVAYARLSEAKLRLFQPMGRLLDFEIAQEIRKMAQKSLELDSTIAEGWGAMVRIYHDLDNDYVKAEQDLKKALRLNPSNASLYDHLLHNTIFLGANVDTAKFYANKSMELDPLNAYYYTSHTFFYMYLRDIKGLKKIAADLEKLFPNNPSSFYCRSWIAYESGDYQKAYELFTPILPLIQPGKLVNVYILYLTILAEVDPEQTREKLRDLKSDSSWAASPFTFAWVHLSLGEKDVFYAYLEEAFQLKDFSSLRLLRFHPDFDEVRVEPRFQQVLKRLNEFLPPFDGRGWGIPYLESAK